MSLKNHVVLAVLGAAFSVQAFASSPASLQKDDIQITSYTTAYKVLDQRDKAGHPLCVMIIRNACLETEGKSCDHGWQYNGIIGLHGNNTICAQADTDYYKYEIHPYRKAGVSHVPDNDDQACINRQKRSLETAYDDDARTLIKDKLHVNEIKIELVDNRESKLAQKMADRLPFGLDLHSEPGKLILHIQEIPTLDRDHCKDLSARDLANQFLDLESVANVAGAVSELPQSPPPQAASAQNTAAVDQSPQILGEAQLMNLEVGLDINGDPLPPNAGSGEVPRQ